MTTETYMVDQRTIDLTPIRAELTGSRARSLGEQIALSIEAKILSGQYAPRQRFPAGVEIAKQIDVSPTAVRDAMNALQARGLVAVRHGYGTTVSEEGHALSAALMTSLMRTGSVTILDLARARAVAETQLSMVAVRNGTSAHWIRLSSILQRMERSIETGDWNSALEAHIAFHSQIIRATNLPVLELLFSPFQHIALLCSLPSLQDIAQWDVEGHRRILRGLESKDEDAVRTEFERHYHDIDDPRFATYYGQPLSKMPLASEILARLREEPGGDNSFLQDLMPQV